MSNKTTNYELNTYNSDDAILETINGFSANMVTLDGELVKKVNSEEGKGLSTNDYTSEEQSKLLGLANIKSIGTNLTLTEEGVLNGNESVVEETDPTVPAHVKAITQEDITKWNNPSTPTLPVATSTTLGGIKVGENLEITDDGTLNAIGGGSSSGGEISNDENTTIPIYKIWVGTEAEYEAIETKDPNTEYNIIEE